MFTQTRIIKHPISCHRNKRSLIVQYIERVIVTILPVGICYGNTRNDLVEKNVVEDCWIYEGPYCF